MGAIQSANLFAHIPTELPQEWFQILVAGDHIKIERIVSKGHCSAPGFWYDQEWDEWVVLLKGSAGLVFENQKAPIELLPGDHLLIPAHTKHRVAWTAKDQETVWLAVHYQ